ncbi:hypothetical protein ACF08M_25430 [Streptomyces sp. NPDC015032]
MVTPVARRCPRPRDRDREDVIASVGPGAERLRHRATLGEHRPR